MAYYEIMKNTAGFISKMLFNIKFENLEKIPKDGKFLLLSNHRSYFDPIFIGIKIKRQMIFLAKESLFRVPILGKIIYKLGVLPVKKGEGDAAIDKAIEIGKAGGVICLFPEGTRSKSGELLRIKSGGSIIAFKSNMNIIPCCVKYEGKLSFRKKVTIQYGDMIKISDICSDFMNVSPKDIKKCNQQISNSIKNMLKE